MIMTLMEIAPRIGRGITHASTLRRRLGILSLLYCGVAVSLMAQDSPTFTLLHSFDNTDGASPFAPVVQGADGNLYGTTAWGGSGTAEFCEYECGTVFKITTGGTFTSLHDFCAQNCNDGGWPYAGLIQPADGSLYGATFVVGVNGYGTLFKIAPGGILTTLQTFDSTDGSGPWALVQASDGNFYGTTAWGGAHSGPVCGSAGGGCGTVFKMTPSGHLTTLYNFCSQSGCADGAEPYGLIQGSDGNFYGTTNYGGTYNGCDSEYTYGCGTVFRITPEGTLTTLYSFCTQAGCADGAYPRSALLQAADGNFYGTTNIGGVNSGGTVFKITVKGALTTFHTFMGPTEGGAPTAPLIQATDGNFYGTTSGGGADGDGAGTVFRITPGGTLTVLYTFSRQNSYADGYQPQAALFQDTNGTFYGTTEGGGTNNCNGIGCGTVFSLSVGLKPFVIARPTFGKVGTSVDILGTNLTGASSVTFNGTSATFTVASSSEITATVPSGATTGEVQVVTPDGTLRSNLPFRVN
jgi:uncharacterized repeat protein (TIGR03803 family)